MPVITETFENDQDVYDSRTLIERMEELEELLDEDHDEDLAAEYDLLVAACDEGSTESDEWEDGVTLVRESYWTEYAKEFAEDTGSVNDNAKWPYTHIDWEAAAKELREGRGEIDIDGVTYILF